MRRILIAVATTLFAAGLVAAPAQAGALEPNPCSGRGDTGVGGSIPSGDNHATIYGTWYNCSGSGTDRVKIDVANGKDGPCLSVAYGTTRSTSFFEGSLWGGNPTYRRWIRC